MIGRLVTGPATDILLQRKSSNLFNLSSQRNNSDESILLILRNNSSTISRALRWIWIDSDGNDTEYTTPNPGNIIQPNRAIYQPTFPTHPWKIIDPTQNNRVLAIYIPESNYPLHELIIAQDLSITVRAGNGGSVMS